MSEFGPGLYKGGELSGSISRAVAASVQQRRQDGMQKAILEANLSNMRRAAQPQLIKCIGALVSETAGVLKRHHVPTDWYLNIQYRSGNREVPAWTLARSEETTSRRTRTYIREMDYYDVTTVRKALLLAENNKLYTFTSTAVDERIAGIVTDNLRVPVSEPSSGEVEQLSDDELVPLDLIVPGRPVHEQPRVLAWRDTLAAHADRLIG